MIKEIADQKFDGERALYASKDILAKNCIFDGPEACILKMYR